MAAVAGQHDPAEQLEVDPGVAVDQPVRPTVRCSFVRPAGYALAMQLYLLGLRTSMRNNATAYGYSVAITCTLAAAQANAGPITTPRLFAFLAGAAIGFVAVEAVASNMFQVREREDPAQVVVLGSAFSLFSISAGVAAGLPATWWLGGWTAWLAAGCASTVVYVLVVGIEMSLARKAEGEEQE